MLVQREPHAAAPTSGARGVRALVLCAEIGEGHVTVARALCAELAAHDEVDAVQLRTDLEAMGR
ncbi:MAG: hypothetical protein JO372_12030 [Solirubrobacterales bacterium]|nr:hypothetical protein [Solirubrobacterales bacterium]